MIKEPTEKLKFDKFEIFHAMSLMPRFLSARPDLVGPWGAHAYSILLMFKFEHRKTILRYLDFANRKFFIALDKHIKIQNPDKKIEYPLGTVCRNREGLERLIIGMDLSKDKPVYDYVDDDGKIGACNESSMVSWMEKI